MTVQENTSGAPDTDWCVQQDSEISILMSCHFFPFVFPLVIRWACKSTGYIISRGEFHGFFSTNNLIPLNQTEPTDVLIVSFFPSTHTHRCPVNGANTLEKSVRPTLKMPLGWLHRMRLQEKLNNNICFATFDSYKHKFVFRFSFSAVSLFASSLIHPKQVAHIRFVFPCAAANQPVRVKEHRKQT